MIREMADIVPIHEHDAPSVLRLSIEHMQAPARGEVCLRQDAISVNYVDTVIRDGRLGMPSSLVLGFEGAGVVVSVGPDVTDHSVGDRVGYSFSAAVYPSKRTTSADALMALPDNITAEQAATFLSRGLAAWMKLRSLHQPQPDAVLAQDVSGGNGSLPSRWLTGRGARIVKVVNLAERSPKAQTGADHWLRPEGQLLPYKTREVGRAEGHVCDSVEPVTFAQSSRPAYADNRVIAIGAASGKPRLDTALLAARRIVAESSHMQRYINAKAVMDASTELFSAIREGLFTDLEVSRCGHAKSAKACQDSVDRNQAGRPSFIS
jgi:NADPH2:quinone reductase